MPAGTTVPASVPVFIVEELEGAALVSLSVQVAGCLSFCSQKLKGSGPLRQYREAKRVIQIRRKGRECDSFLEGISPVGAASPAFTLELNGKSLPGLSGSPGHACNPLAGLSISTYFLPYKVSHVPLHPSASLGPASMPSCRQARVIFFQLRHSLPSVTGKPMGTRRTDTHQVLFFLCVWERWERRGSSQSLRVCSRPKGCKTLC